MAPNKRGSSSYEGNDERDLQLPLCKRKVALPDTRYLSSLDSTNDMALILEPVIRKVLQEMMPPILEQVMPRMLEQVIPPILQRYLPSPMINITAEDSSPLQVAVCDATIQNTKVTKGDGPSLKVQLCVLKADFESEDWTAEEFNSNIESPREGKGPLLKGDTHFMLPKNASLRDASAAELLKQRPSNSRKHKPSKENDPPSDPNIFAVAASDSKPSPAKLKSPLPPRPPSSNQLKRKLSADAFADNSVPTGSSDSGVRVVVRMRPLCKDKDE
ncbi:Kinesin-like proteinB [Arachis hypogaea]|nr:Kinesin-like proteinB [Arachis hypogaea]